MPAPLEGIRMIDLSRQLPGQFCSSMLSNYGVEVISVLAPGDTYGLGQSTLSRNKKSLTLNLRTAEGRTILYRLTEGTDIVLEGFRPGTAKRLGIDYDSLGPMNSGLIYCSISCYGQDGPYRDMPGFDLNGLGVAGILDISTPSGSLPSIPAIQVGDIGGAGLMAFAGILMAVIARSKTGRGQYVDISMLDGLISWLAYPLGLVFDSAKPLDKSGNIFSGKTPGYDVYQTKDSKLISIASYEGRFWSNLCRVLGREEFTTDIFPAGERGKEIYQVFREIFRTKTREEWLSILGKEETIFAPVNELEEVLEDPQVLYRQMIVEMDDPHTGGKKKQIGLPIKFSQTPGVLKNPPPALGEHTRELLISAGYTEGDIVDFRSKGII